MASRPVNTSGRLHGTGEGFPHLNSNNGACMCTSACCWGVNGCICRNCSGVGHSGCSRAQYVDSHRNYSPEPNREIIVVKRTRRIVSTT